jgi:hypothetical protein
VTQWASKAATAHKPLSALSRRLATARAPSGRNASRVVPAGSVRPLEALWVRLTNPRRPNEPIGAQGRQRKLTRRVAVKQQRRRLYGNFEMGWVDLRSQRKSPEGPVEHRLAARESVLTSLTAVAAAWSAGAVNWLPTLTPDRRPVQGTPRYRRRAGVAGDQPQEACAVFGSFPFREVRRNPMFGGRLECLRSTAGGSRVLL